MNILVCVKQVPEHTELALHDEKHTLRRDRAGAIINPADCCALEQALRLKETHGAQITVMTMGPMRARGVLEEIAAHFVDRIVLLSDADFAGADTLATARTLHAAAEKLGGFDLVLLGRRAIDGETGHVGPELAALGGVKACLTNVLDCRMENGQLCCIRLLENEKQEWTLPLPAIVTLCGGTHALRPPSIEGLRRAKDVEFRHLTRNDVELAKTDVGLTGSPTRILSVRRAQEGRRQVAYYDNVEEGIRAICVALRAGPAVVPQAVPWPEAQPPHGEVRAGALARTVVVSIQGDAKQAQVEKELASAVVAMGVSPLCVRVAGEDDVACAGALAAYIAEHRPEVALFPATIRGRCVAPYCAALLRAGLTADITAMHVAENGRLMQVRPAFGGALLAEIQSNGPLQMASVRPGVFAAQDGIAYEVVQLQGGAAAGRCMRAEKISAARLADAKVIVAGGKGVGSREGFGKLQGLAAAMGAAMGASRAAVDAGYAPYDYQVGQTGLSVRPQAYLAFGISGAVQHIAGMKDAGVVIAVNADRRARIFEHADIGIAADWEDVADELMRALQKEKEEGL